MALDQKYREFAIATFCRLIEVDSPSGDEKDFSQSICQVLDDIFGEEIQSAYDNAYVNFAHHGLNGHCGNMFATIPATPGYENIPCLGFNAHMDRVEPGRGIKPQVLEDRIVSDGTTILAGDDVAGITIILTMVKILHDEGIPHGELQLIFTVCEEFRTLGARYIAGQFIAAEMIFSFDGDTPDSAIVGTCGSDKYTINITGKTAHAGMHPERGISALMITAVALQQLKEDGFIGRLVDRYQPDPSDPTGHKHVASTNFVVSDYQKVGTNSVQAGLTIIGEVRAFDPAKMELIQRRIKSAFEIARHKATGLSESGAVEVGSVEFTIDRAYEALVLDSQSEVVQRSKAAIESVGLSPRLRTEMGGLDACWLNQHVPTTALGMGIYDYHTKNERLMLEEFFQAIEIAVHLATAK